MWESGQAISRNAGGALGSPLSDSAELTIVSETTSMTCGSHRAGRGSGETKHSVQLATASGVETFVVRLMTLSRGAPGYSSSARRSARRSADQKVLSANPKRTRGSS